MSVFVHVWFFFFLDSLSAEINLTQRRGSDFVIRDFRRDSCRDNLSAMKPLLQQKTPLGHPPTGRSLSLQAPPVDQAPTITKRSMSTKKREGKTQSLICYTPEGRYLEALMWEGADFFGPLVDISEYVVVITVRNNPCWIFFIHLFITSSNALLVKLNSYLAFDFILFFFSTQHPSFLPTYKKHIFNKLNGHDKQHFMEEVFLSVLLP